jgi:hypothetical protein
MTEVAEGSRSHTALAPGFRVSSGSVGVSVEGLDRRAGTLETIAPVDSATVESAPVDSATVESAPVDSATLASATLAAAPVEMVPVVKGAAVGVVPVVVKS